MAKLSWCRLDCASFGPSSCVRVSLCLCHWLQCRMEHGVQQDAAIWYRNTLVAFWRLNPELQDMNRSDTGTAATSRRGIAPCHLDTQNWEEICSVPMARHCKESLTNCRHSVATKDKASYCTWFHYEVKFLSLLPVFRCVVCWILKFDNSSL
jgi:hypothetical protein